MFDVNICDVKPVYSISYDMETLGSHSADWRRDLGSELADNMHDNHHADEGHATCQDRFRPTDKQDEKGKHGQYPQEKANCTWL